MNRLGKLMTMLNPEKTQMPPPRTRCRAAASPPSSARAPRGARHAAEAALPGGDRGRLLRARLLLGRRAAVLGTRRRLHDRGRLHERDHAEPDLRGGLQRAGPATPRRCWSPSTRPRSPTPTCSRSSSRSTTRPRGCARATTSAPSTAPGIYFANDAQKATAEMALRGLRRGPARRRPRADHDRGRAGRALLLRRGLPPAVPAQGARTATAAWPAPASPAAFPAAAS